MKESTFNQTSLLNFDAYMILEGMAAEQTCSDLAESAHVMKQTTQHSGSILEEIQKPIK